MRWIAVVTAVALLAPAAATASAGTRPHPRLKAAGHAPLYVRGTGFLAHERVRVVLRATGEAAVVRRATAAPGGALEVTFPGGSGPCVRVSVTATGSLGSQARMIGIKLPDCIVR